MFVVHSVPLYKTERSKLTFSRKIHKQLDFGDIYPVEFTQDVVFVADAEIKSRQCGGLLTQITVLGRSQQRPKFPFSIPALIYMSLNTALHYPLQYIWQIPALPMLSLALAIPIATAPALCAPFC